MIPDAGQDGCCDKAILNLILFIVFIGVSCLTQVIHHGKAANYIPVILILIYIISLVEAFCGSTTYKYLSNVISFKQVNGIINTLR